MKVRTNAETTAGTVSTSMDSRLGTGPARIELVEIETLRPNPKNARTHSRKQKRQIAASIKKFGFLNPLIIDENNMILAGHGRVEAARLEGLVHVPVIRFDHLTPAQKRAYVIADNRIAEQAGWDREMLAIEFGELINLLPIEDFDISLTGFEIAEIDVFLADRGPPKAAAEDIPPPPPRTAVTRRGDVWLLKKNRLLCGDAQLIDDFNRVMNGASAKAVFCDPPYNLRISRIGKSDPSKFAEFAFGSGEMSPLRFRKFLFETLGNGARASAEGAVHFVCIDWRHVADLIEVGRELYGAMLNLVVWNKSNAGQGSFYRSQHELIGVFRVGEDPHRNNVELGRFGRNRSNVWNYPVVSSGGSTTALADHPTVKPVTLVADALLDCTAPGDVVLDQFAGSGTILLAAEKIGRIAYGMEYEPRYCDVAVERWQRMTKLEATLAGDGRSFEEIARLRGAISRPVNRSALLFTSLIKNETTIGLCEGAPALKTGPHSEKSHD